MANGIYNYAKQAYSFPGIITDNIKVVLVRGYVPNYSTDQFLSNVTGGGGTLVATSANLSGKTWVGGLFDAANVTLTAVPAGLACDFLVIYYDTGVAGTSVLICALDTGFTGLPVTPDGSDILITWAAGGIFQL